MSNVSEERIQELIDRQDIVDCLHRYCRALSRLDEELLLSVYHEDAMHCTVTFSGPPREFVKWYWGLRPPSGSDVGASDGASSAAPVRSTAFYLTNESIDLDGDVAHVETYYLTVVCPEQSSTEGLYGGRYIDRFERRDGVWRIAVRVVLGEWSTTVPRDESDLSLGLGQLLASRDRNDVSYERPLRARPAPVTS